MSSELAERSEENRILAEYAQRAQRIEPGYYALSDPANLFIHQSHVRALVRGLRHAGWNSLQDKHVLETGCGDGDWLLTLANLGIAFDHLSGIELSSERAAISQQKLPGASISCGSARQLPWENATFDLVFHRMMFSSILDDELRRAAAAEQLRVVKPNGLIIWLDFFYNNPRNKQVRGIGRREIRELFPRRAIDFQRVTLAPPLIRRLVPISWSLCELLQGMRVFNTYYLAVIRP